MSAAPSRFSRLLAMVPYFLARPGIKVSAAAAELGVSEAQLTKDLEQLFVCGLPGYGGGDLIDIQFWDGYVTVGFTAGMDRPLKLTGTEASVLLVALRMLLDAGGALDADAVRRAMAKLEDAVGSSSRAVVADPASGVSEPASSSTVRRAVTDRRALRMTYYTPSRDEVTERTVDPIRVQVVDGHTYLDAWCRESDGRRLFRFDRIQAAEVLDEPSSPPAEAAATPVAMPAQNEALPVAVIEIDPGERWVLEYYAAEPETDPADHPDLPIRARITYASPEWLARLLQGFGGRVRLVSDDDQAQKVLAAMAASTAAARDRYSNDG
ncbi:MAG: WYL domain-containing protein [Gordonia sp. (in: high G+C Gram-positive bacteria)]|uniref:helix-turn-helix transcriptional regulator n=1 Tax=Gordonia sp. (in: high G+C Gram-positive bacteria) TaxID=84139 RepID=UPI0039E6EFB1